MEGEGDGREREGGGDWKHTLAQCRGYNVSASEKSCELAKAGLMLDYVVQCMLVDGGDPGILRLAVLESPC